MVFTIQNYIHVIYSIYDLVVGLYASLSFIRLLQIIFKTYASINNI